MLITRVAPFFEPSFRLSDDPILGFGLSLEPADVFVLPAWMRGDHIPFVPPLDGLNDRRSGLLRHLSFFTPRLRLKEGDVCIDRVYPRESLL